eukprot:13795454-Alexandrium_andersonii.AAC.1
MLPWPSDCHNGRPQTRAQKPSFGAFCTTCSRCVWHPMATTRSTRRGGTMANTPRQLFGPQCW